MAIRLIGNAATGWRTTDHHEEITELLRAADDGSLREVDRRALHASAALLACHDQTGISLDDWDEPRELVEYLLGRPILRNKVWRDGSWRSR